MSIFVNHFDRLREIPFTLVYFYYCYSEFGIFSIFLGFLVFFLDFEVSSVYLNYFLTHFLYVDNWHLKEQNYKNKYFGTVSTELYVYFVCTHLKQSPGTHLIAISWKIMQNYLILVLFSIISALVFHIEVNS